MRPHSDFPVVIVGAGPTGVTAATLLGQHGIQTLVLDRWAGIYPQPRAVHLDDEIYRILGRLGVAAEFAAISRPALGLRLLDKGMGVLAEFHRDVTRSRNGHPQANMFDQPELEAVLRANLKRYPSVTLRGDSEVTHLTDLAAGRTRISVTDRAGGGERIVECDYLLGCDGANSLVRRHIGARMRDLRFEQRWLVIDIDSAVDLQQWGGVHQLCDPRRAGTFMQIGDSRYRWEFRLLDDESAGDFSTLAALRPLISPWLSTATDADLRIIRVAEYTFRAQVADRWRRGNVFLLGDAAHLTPPFIGQGMCAGLRDAMNLAWKLAGVLAGGLPAAVLDSYQQERKPHVRSMIGLALMIGYAMTAGGRAGDVLRRTVAPRMHRVPGLSAVVMDSATPRLRHSGWVDRSRRRTDPAGGLCPNAMMPDGRRLDSILGPGFTLLTATRISAGERRSLGSRGVAVVEVPPESELADWLRRSKSEAVIVRPDFTVMRAGGLTHLCESGIR